MAHRLRVLMVEDSAEEVALIARELERGGYEPSITRVDNAEELTAALTQQTWDIVLSDYVMPGFSALEALHLVHRYQADLPFIIVSGGVGEEVAVAGVKAGANDYIMKLNLKRLPSVVERELREAEARRQRQQTEMQLNLLQASIAHINDGVVILKAQQGVPIMEPIIYVNRAFTTQTGYTWEEVVGRDLSFLLGAKSDPVVVRRLHETLTAQGSAREQLIGYTKEQKELWLEIEISPRA